MVGLSVVVPNRLGAAGATALAAALQHVTRLQHLNLRCPAQSNNPTQADPLSDFTSYIHRPLVLDFWALLDLAA